MSTLCNGKQTEYNFSLNCYSIADATRQLPELTQRLNNCEYKNAEMKTYTNDTNDGKLWLRFFVVVWHVQQKIFGRAGFTDCSPTHPTV